MPRLAPHRAPCPHPAHSCPALATPCARPTYRRLLVPTTATTCPTRPTPAGSSLKLPAAARQSNPCHARPSPVLPAITIPTLSPLIFPSHLALVAPTLSSHRPLPSHARRRVPSPLFSPRLDRLAFASLALLSPPHLLRSLKHCHAFVPPTLSPPALTQR